MSDENKNKEFEEKYKYSCLVKDNHGYIESRTYTLWEAWSYYIWPIP